MPNRRPNIRVKEKHLINAIQLYTENLYLYKAPASTLAFLFFRCITKTQINNIRKIEIARSEKESLYPIYFLHRFLYLPNVRI